MSQNISSISEKEREEIARELGVYDEVKAGGWGNVSSKDCGNIVKKAIERSGKAENRK